MANPQQLISVITIRGNVDSSANSIARFLDGIGSRIQALGGQLNQISQPLLQLSQDSVNLYADFEDHMRYIQGLGELTTSQMKELEEAARQAGATTRYTASDAAQALEDNAVAGLNYKDSIALLNTELTAAAAGNIDLTTAASQLLSALAITGTEIGDAQAYVDKWVKTAASSKSDVEGLGEAVERLGVTMQYLNGGETEMFTIFGELGNLGAEGAEIGTYARNVLLNLIAPTNKSAEVMEALGYSVEEVEDALDGLDTGESKKLIDRLGLEIYDEDTGKLRNMFDILTDLDTALASMTDEERNKAMSTIFNKRTLGYAEGLMKVAASGEWRELFQNIADADGYAEQVANKRESGLGGALRIFKSQWEEVQLSIGEVLTPTVTDALEGIGEVFTSFSNLDEETKTRIVDVMGALAVAGPALLGVGTAMKILAFAATPEGAIALATVGLVGLAKAMSDVNRINFSNNFGDIELDMDELGKYINQLSDDFNAAYKDADQFNDAAADAITNYAELRKQFGQKIITAALAGTALTDSDKEQLAGMGEDMIQELYNGMLNITARDMDVINQLNEGGYLDDENYSSITDSLGDDFTQTSARLKTLGQALYDALMGDFTPEETRERVQAVLDEIDEIAQEEYERTKSIQQQAMIEKARWVSQENAQQYFGDLNAGYEQAVADYNERAASTLAELYLEAEKSGDWSRYNATQEAMDKHRADLSIPFMNAAETAMDTLFTNSGLGDLYQGMMDVINGEMTMQEFSEGVGRDRLSDVSRTLDMMQPMIEMLANSDLYSQYAMLQGPDNWWDKLWHGGSKFLKEYEYAEDNRSAKESNEAASQWLYDHIGRLFTWQFKEDELTPAEKAVYGNDTAESESNLQEIITNAVVGAIQDAPQGLQFDTSIDRDKYSKQFSKYADSVQSEREFVANIQANVDALQTTIDEETAKERTVPVDGDLGALESSINDFRAQQESNPIELTVTMRGGVGGGGVNKPALYADGGRADRPSIFGEAGAEWAIPERHTERTAALLRAAASASGFTWSELLTSRGGLNGNVGGTSIVFSPQITAGDTAGLKAALDDAQRRFFAQLKREHIISARVNYAQ